MRAKEIYDGYMAMRSETGKMSIHQNMPKVSGSLKWSSELRDRIASPMVSFKSMEHPYVILHLFKNVYSDFTNFYCSTGDNDCDLCFRCMESKEAHDCYEHYDQMLALLGG